MTIEKAIADQTAAIQENTKVLQLVLQAIKAGGSVGASSQETKSSSADTKSNKNTSDTPEDTDSQEEAPAIYWHIPGTEEFGTVNSEAEFKKLKKAKPKTIKIPESKYAKLVEAASDDGDTAEYSDRIKSLIAEVPEEPDVDDIADLFRKYLSADLEKSERSARIELVKPILEAAGAAKATAVSEDKRRDVMVALIKAMEVHLEETGQVDASEDDGLV